MTANAVVGKPFSFTVHCLNAKGNDVPDTNGPIVATLDTPAAGSVSCNPDGTNGIFMPSADNGTVVILVADGKLNGQSDPITLTPDNTPVSLTVTMP